MKKVLDRAVAVGIILFLLLGLFWMYLRPDEINTYENRYANQAPRLTAASYLDGSFQDGFDLALADQIPFSQRGKRIYNEKSTALLRAELKPLLERERYKYVSFGTDWIYNDYLVYKPQTLDDTLKGELDAKITNINNCIAAHPELKFYAYYVKRDMDVDFETGTQTGEAEYLEQGLDLASGGFSCLNIGDFAAYSKNFYKTDHHWNAQGSYEGYREAAALLGVSENELLAPTGEADTGRQLSGSKAASSRATSVITEPFSVLTFDYPAEDVTINGKKASAYGKEDTFLADTAQKASYANYYGEDYGEIIFDTHRTDRDSILVIGDSYDNAVLRLLSAHFNKTFSVDLRNYQAQTGRPFRLSEYVKANGITKVLLIGGSSFYSKPDFTLEG